LITRGPFFTKPVRILVAAAALGLSQAAFAQDQGPAAPSSERALVGQEQLVRELLQRLDAQDAANAELRRRVAALEALLPMSASAAPPQETSAPALATVDERITSHTCAPPDCRGRDPSQTLD
jgi:hypothetical protein